MVFSHLLAVNLGQGQHPALLVRAVPVDNNFRLYSSFFVVEGSHVVAAMTFVWRVVAQLGLPKGWDWSI